MDAELLAARAKLRRTAGRDRSARGVRAHRPESESDGDDSDDSATEAYNADEENFLKRRGSRGRAGHVTSALKPGSVVEAYEDLAYESAHGSACGSAYGSSRGSSRGGASAGGGAASVRQLSVHEIEAMRSAGVELGNGPGRTRRASRRR